MPGPRGWEGKDGENVLGGICNISHVLADWVRHAPAATPHLLPVVSWGGTSWSPKLCDPPLATILALFRRLRSSKRCVAKFTTPVSVWEGVQYSCVSHFDTPAQLQAWAHMDRTDDRIVCPYYWAQLIYVLNSEIFWLAALDQPHDDLFRRLNRLRPAALEPQLPVQPLLMTGIHPTPSSRRRGPIRPTSSTSSYSVLSSTIFCDTTPNEPGQECGDDEAHEPHENDEPRIQVPHTHGIYVSKRIVQWNISWLLPLQVALLDWLIQLLFHRRRRRHLDIVRRDHAVDRGGHVRDRWRRHGQEYTFTISEREQAEKEGKKDEKKKQNDEEAEASSNRVLGHWKRYFKIYIKTFHEHTEKGWVDHCTSVSVGKKLTMIRRVKTLRSRGKSGEMRGFQERLKAGVTDAKDVEIRHNSDSRGNWRIYTTEQEAVHSLMESMWSAARHGIKAYEINEK
ncbi:hypothetical protein B0H12DRAFT_1079519 [Mycena haematopus]|nr:hypothetical protein B0H12DRAFT_1079519 [Mycena haematopus]